ncbi:glycosyltransferase family 2 protein [Phosphitispora sp. TUW77]|uniref:glycosyltransferase family 2 protein n=1 Tax=Phosphitispora sp. TUW77 TaxID=3152361 RepID=UPI003AB116EE
MSKIKPLVSIITPSYNQGRFIEDTINSVLSQEYPNFEYIVVDGGSTDDTLSILEKYSTRLRWISESDKGQSDAINKGFKMAKGEIVAWLNSDDTYELGAIEKAVSYMTANPKVALVYGHAGIIDEYGKWVRQFEATEPFNLWRLIHVWDYIMQPTTFFRKKALQEVGYLREDLNWCMDWDLWIRLGRKYAVGFIPEVLANNREYEETKTSTGGWSRLKEITSVMREKGEKKYPPGLFIYGIDTIASYFRQKNVLVKPINILAGKLINYILNNIPSVYPDGWIGVIAHLLLIRDKETKFLLKGEMPGLSNVLPLNVEIYVERTNIKSVQINSSGEFMLEVPISLPKKKLLEVTIRTDKCFCPASQVSKSRDKRKLSFRVLEIIMID